LWIGSDRDDDLDAFRRRIEVPRIQGKKDDGAGAAGAFANDGVVG
jgi:hypothetical protein